MEENQKIINKQEQLRNYDKVNKRCDDCSNAGLISAISKENGFEYSFRCHCTAGTIIGPGYPVWNEALLDRYHKVEMGMK